MELDTIYYIPRGLDSKTCPTFELSGHIDAHESSIGGLGGCDDARGETLGFVKSLVWRPCVLQTWCMCQYDLVGVDARTLRIFGRVTSFNWR